MTITISESIEQTLDSLRKPSGRVARFANSAYLAKLKAVNESLIAPAFRGDSYARLDLREAMSRSDFPILFGDVLYRRLARAYAAQPQVWQKIAKRELVNDFRAHKLVDILGGKGVLDDVAELAPFPRRKLEESEIEYQVGKVGATVAYSWEAGVNDDLSAFATLPERLAQAARLTEDRKVTAVYATATGPAAWLGTADNKPLTPENLEAAIQKITSQEDEDGNPIIIDTPVLIVPQSLALTAQQIVDTVTVKTTANSREREIRGNGLSVTPEIVVNPHLTAIDKSSKAAATWYFLPWGLVTPKISMCSANQPGLPDAPSAAALPMLEAMRSAKHFLPSRALPP